MLTIPGEAVSPLMVGQSQSVATQFMRSGSGGGWAAAPWPRSRTWRRPSGPRGDQSCAARSPTRRSSMDCSSVSSCSASTARVPDQRARAERVDASSRGPGAALRAALAAGALIFSGSCGGSSRHRQSLPPAGWVLALGSHRSCTRVARPAPARRRAWRPGRGRRRTGGAGVALLVARDPLVTVVVVACAVAGVQCARLALTGRVSLPRAPRPTSPVLIFNPRSGRRQGGALPPPRRGPQARIEPVEMSMDKSLEATRGGAFPRRRGRDRDGRW